VVYAFIIVSILGLSLALVSAIFLLRQRRREAAEIAEVRMEREIFRTSPPPFSLQTETRLESKDLFLASLIPPKVRKRNARVNREGHQCPKCFRTYENARFCYVDGEALNGHLGRKITFWGCTTCGEEGRHRCQCEEGPLRIHSEVACLPLIPLARCNVCQTLGNMESRCDCNGELRHPISRLDFSAFPSMGFGPRKRVCAICGSLFPSSAKFCSKDGSRLQFLN